MLTIQIIAMMVAGFVPYKTLTLRGKRDVVSLASIIAGLGLGIVANFEIIGNGLWAAIKEEPVGFSHVLAYQLPSSVWVLFAMYVGVVLARSLRRVLRKRTMVETAADRAITPGVAIGGLLGLLLGNAILETGEALHMMALDGLTDAELESAKIQGILNAIVPIAKGTGATARELGYGVWFSLVGSVGGFIYGFRNKKII